MAKQAESAEEFKNDNVDVKVFRKPGCLVKFEITVHPKAAEAAYKQATKAVKKEVSIPGFRKGKASDALVQQHYGPHVEREFRDVIVQTAYHEAVTLSKIYPINEKSIMQPHLKSCSKEDGAKVVIEMETLPVIPTINPKELHVAKLAKEEVTDQQVQDTIANIQQHHAKWEEVTGRVVTEGDFIELDVDAIDDPSHNICKDTLFEVKKNHMANWMIKLVLGMNVGDHVEGVSEKEEQDHVHTENCTHESHAHEDEFKATRCRIHLKAIKKSILPPVDDELAIKVGVKTAEELPAKIRENLEKQLETQMEAKQRQEVDKALASQFDFEVPASLVQKEYKSFLTDKLKRMSQNPAQADTIEKRRPEIEAEAMREAIDQLRIFFITRKIAEDHKITVSQDEILKELSRQMWGSAPGQSVIDSNMQPDEIRSRLYLMIMTNKAKDLILQEAAS